MRRSTTIHRPRARAAAGLALFASLLAGGADGPTLFGWSLDAVLRRAEPVGRQALARYHRTTPMERITWGGLAACSALGLATLLGRMIRLRRRRVVPPDFLDRFLGRLREGKLDRLRALDLCELNPSPAARVALAAVGRWGRPVADLERAVALAGRIEADQLRRNVGTLRRIAALTPLLGLLGTLTSAGRVLVGSGQASGGMAWGPAMADALGPLTAGVALAIVALAVYDSLVVRVEDLVNALDRLGAQTVDAIAMAPIAHPRPGDPRSRPVDLHAPSGARTPHQVRVEIPDALVRREDEPA